MPFLQKSSLHIEPISPAGLQSTGSNVNMFRLKRVRFVDVQVLVDHSGKYAKLEFNRKEMEIRHVGQTCDKMETKDKNGKKSVSLGGLFEETRSGRGDAASSLSVFSFCINQRN